MFLPSSLLLKKSLRAFLAAGVLIWALKADVSTISGLVVSLIDSLKSDIFCPEALKSFKVDFKLKLLVDTTDKRNVMKTTDETNDSKPVQNIVTDQLDSLSLEETSALDSKTCDEREELSKWVSEFKEKREKVPNPYLSYSHLVQVLATIRANSNSSEDHDKFSKFWEQSTAAVDA